MTQILSFFLTPYLSSKKVYSKKAISVNWMSRLVKNVDSACLMFFR